MTTDTSLDAHALFDFEALTPDHLRAAPSHSPMARLYGGQVVAQALAACQQSVAEDRFANNCHANFIRAGDPALPLDFILNRDSDGRSFSARRVVVSQQGRVILSMSASFHVPEAGAQHQFAMPAVPGPAALATQAEVLSTVADRLPARHRAFWLRESLFEYRPVERFFVFDPPIQAPRRHVWMRYTGPLVPDGTAAGDRTAGDRTAGDRATHQRLLAYASDLHILHTALLPLGRSWADALLQDASLDHAIWFHSHARADEWLLYVLDSPFAGGALGLGRGLIYTADGRLVASVAQQGLIRFPTPE